MITAYERSKRLVRADIIDLLRDEAMTTVHFVSDDLTKCMDELLQNKKNFCSAFGLVQYISKNSTTQHLIKEYKACVDKEKKKELRRNKQAEFVFPVH